MTSRLIASSVVFGAFAACGLAHESALLVAVENDHHPETFQVTAGTLFEFERTNGEDVFTLSPAASLGILPHLALGVSARFTDEHGNFAFESAMPNIQFLWHPKNERIPLHIHAHFGYQFADEQDEGGHGEEADSHHHDEEDHHEEVDHHEDEAVGHDHDFRSAVHSHGLDLFTGRVELDYRIGNTLLRGGVIGTVFDDGDVEFGYSAGLLQKIIEPVHVALDVFGDFDAEGYHEVSGTVYFRATDEFQLSTGLAFGLTDQAPDSIVRFGVTYRF